MSIDVDMVRRFLSLPGEAIPSAYVKVPSIDTDRPAWPILRRIAAGETCYDALGYTIVMRADRDEWRDGVEIYFELAGGGQ